MMRRPSRSGIVAALASLAFLVPGANGAGSPVVIGSKKFTESYVLAEIARGAMAARGIPAGHRQGMGGTIILWEALRTGQIDCYPEYTGTIVEEILKTSRRPDAETIRRELAKSGVGMTGELGFNNTYALVMRRQRAVELGISRISDLNRHPDLRFGLTHEFVERRDGWRPLAKVYRLEPSGIQAIDHALGYSALRHGSIDVKDAYSTDAKIAEEDLVTLEDDRAFFPRYEAVFLYQLALPAPAISALNSLERTLDEKRMIQLNAEAERTKDYGKAADLYFGNSNGRVVNTLAARIARWTMRHLQLAGLALLLSVTAGIPLGIIASRGGPMGQTIMAITGAVQTIPSLALLALLVPVPFFGISARTAIAALFLYGLLPIVRNTATGLQNIPLSLRESSIALGLTRGARLWQIDLPLASRTILAGIKTSAVINIGTATLAALIGAGGLGEPIISGLNLNDHATILQGAIPAAVLALLVQWLFEFADRLLIPKGLRL